MAQVSLRDMVKAVIDAASEFGYIVIVGEGNASRVTLEIVDADGYRPEPAPPALGVSVTDTIETEDRFGG